MVYFIHGQPKSGKSTIGQRLQFWLQTDKKNWRKSVFHIDEEYSELYLEIAKYLNRCGNDVVISMVCPSKEIRDKFKTNCKLKEIYCHTSKKVGTEHLLLENYEKPESFYIDLDTSNPIDQTFEKLIKMLI
jgi:adenylylsulfate kinase-like enzyme